MGLERGEEKELDMGRTIKVLIAEDDSVLADNLADILISEKYQVYIVNSGDQVMEKINQITPDVILLDLMLPGIDGMTLIQSIRNRYEHTLKIIVISARSDDIIKVAALALGADDYMIKPIVFRELKARITAVLRLVPQHREDSPVIRTRDLIVDTLRREVYRVTTGPNNVESHEIIQGFSPKAFDLLVYLVRNANMILTRETILAVVWGPDCLLTTGIRTVDVHVRWLRILIEPDRDHPTYIISKRGYGYLWDDYSK